MGLFPHMALLFVAVDVCSNAPLWAVQGYDGAKLTLAFPVKLTRRTSATRLSTSAGSSECMCKYVLLMNMLWHMYGLTYAP